MARKMTTIEMQSKRLNAEYDRVQEIASKLGHGRAVLTGGGGTSPRRIEFVLDPAGAERVAELLDASPDEDVRHLAENSPKVAALVKFIDEAEDTVLGSTFHVDSGLPTYGKLIVGRRGWGTTVWVHADRMGMELRRVDLLENTQIRCGTDYRPALDVLVECGYYPVQM